MTTSTRGYLTSVEAWERAEGAAAPLGAAWIEEEQSYNFALYSRHATEVSLLLYSEHDLVEPVYQRQLDFLRNKTGRVWHCWVPAAEAWDIGAYLLGRSFPGISWLQWNGQFRDDIRGFVKGDSGKVSAMMRRLYGSDDLFPDAVAEACRPSQSVNFITAHDGFCLYDLVAYNQKHNQANGHNNTDGADSNLSWNCGWEGDQDAPPEVCALRRRQVKNLFALLMLANGTPMFCAGDEFMNTQRGNNNPYNQDNEITWLDWDLLKRNGDVFRFFKHMIAFRKAHPSIHRSRFWRQDVRWYGVDGPPDLGYDSHTLAYCLHGASLGDHDLYVMINIYWEDLVFAIQAGQPGAWRRAIDTALPSPADAAAPGEEAVVDGLSYRVQARSVVVLRGAAQAHAQRHS